jgi:hypothetical protein
MMLRVTIIPYYPHVDITGNDIFSGVTCRNGDELGMHTIYFCLMMVHLEIVMIVIFHDIS